MAEPTIEQAEQGIHRMAEDLTRSHKEATGLFDSLLGLSRSILPGFVQLREFFHGTSFGRGISQSYQALGKTVQQLTDQRQLEFLALDKKLREGDLTREMYDRQLKSLVEQEAVFEKQLDVSRESQKLGTARLTIAKLLVIEAGKLWIMSRELNQNLIEANSSYEHRYRLVYDTLSVMRETGASFDQATKISAALVRYGFDTHKNYRDVANRIQMMNEGLGMSVDLAAQLAVVSETRLETSFEAVGNSIATLVNSTSLAADEAGRLAVNLGRVMATLGPSIDATALSGVTQLVGQYESALKELGGQSGLVEQFLTRLTTTEGLAAAGAVGAINPEFIATEQGVESVLDRFADYAETFIGQASGRDRMMRLEMLGQLFGMNAQNTQLLIETLERKNQQNIQAITVEDRYRQQLHATSDAIGRAYNALISLVHGGMYPLIWAASKGLSIIADILQWIVKYEPVAYTAMAAVFLGIVYMITSLTRLTAAFARSTFAAHVMAAAESRLAATRLAGAAQGAVGQASRVGSIARIGGILARGFALLANPLGILVVITGTLVGFAYYFKKKADEAAILAQQARLGAATVAENLEKAYTRQLSLAAGTGDPNRVKQVLARLESDIPKMIKGYDKMDALDQHRARESLLVNMQQIAALSEQRRRLFYTELGPKELAADKASQDLQKELIAVQKNQQEVFKTEWRAQRRALEEKERRALLWSRNPPPLIRTGY